MKKTKRPVKQQPLTFDRFAVLFVTGILAGAVLLFLIEPMVAKMILPLLGGSPSVWTTCMVFFQIVLLAGYAYAHVLGKLKSTRIQVVVHTLVLIITAATLPIGLPQGESWKPNPEGSPMLWTLALLAVSVGGPFFALSTTGPLLQKWFSTTSHPDSQDPYFLYAASNAGSMLSLLAYPLLIEPRFALGAQRTVWSFGYGVFALVCIACGVAAFRRPALGASAKSESEAAATGVPSASTRLRWTLLAVVPSSMMLGTTFYLSMDIASFPLLWIIPLTIYLLTFIVAFSSLGKFATRVCTTLLPPAAVAMGVLFLQVDLRKPVGLLIAAHLSMLFIAAMACHGRLSQERPAASRLTEFYLLISAGGVLGGLFNALAAPRLFNSVAEYPIAIAAACLLGAWGTVGVGDSKRVWRYAVLTAAMPAAVLLSFVAIRSGWGPLGAIDSRTLLLLRWLVPASLCLIVVRRRLMFSAALAALLFIPIGLQSSTRQLHVERTFFGIHRVHSVRDGSSDWHQLWHGRTLHGQQYNQRPWSLIPTTYYSRSGPIGDVLSMLAARNTPASAALIGMGAGTLAAYGRDGLTMTYYEIDPAVIRIASDRSLFTYVSDSRSHVGSVAGDARITLGRAPDGSYDLIAVDAFSSDAIPVHLITRQAVQLYFCKLAENGVVAFHITNWYLDLVPVLGNIASDLKLNAMIRRDGNITKDDLGKYISVWVLMARDKASFGALANDSRWLPVPAQPRLRTWTDDYSDILSVIRW